MSGIFHFTCAWPQMVLRRNAKKRYQVCYTKHTALMMTLGYRPEALESFHHDGTKTGNCEDLNDLNPACEDLNPALQHDKKGILPFSHHTSMTILFN